MSDTKSDIAKLISNLKPDLRFTEGKIVPAKNIRWKQDPNTKKIVKIYPPKSKKFEASLNKWLKDELKETDEFPTKEEVFVLVVYNFVTKKTYQECDLDNVTKTIMDGMKEGAVFHDDSQVRSLLIFKTNDQKIPDSYGVGVTILKNNQDRKFLSEFNRLLYK